MAQLDWSQCAAVESVADRRSGEWVLRDTRMPVATIFENLDEMSLDEIADQYEIDRSQIEAVLDFVAASLRSPQAAVQHVPELETASAYSF